MAPSSLCFFQRHADFPRRDWLYFVLQNRLQHPGGMGYSLRLMPKLMAVSLKIRKRIASIHFKSR
jgi:hypothetical protein